MEKTNTQVFVFLFIKHCCFYLPDNDFLHTGLFLMIGNLDKINALLYTFTVH